MMRTPGELKLLPAFPVAAYGKVSAVRLTRHRQQGGCQHPDRRTGTAAGSPVYRLAERGRGRPSDRLPPGRGLGVDGAFQKELETNYPQTKDALKQVQAFLAVNSHYFRVNSTGNTDDLTLRVVSQLHVDNEAGKVITATSLPNG